jgi:hypothetical protein
VPYFNSEGLSLDNPEIPVISLVYINTSGKTVEALEFSVCPKNPFGDPLEHRETGEKCVQLFYDAEIKPFPEEPTPYLPLDKDKAAKILAAQVPGTGTIGWSLEGFSGAMRAEVALVRMLFSDDTVWPEFQVIPTD